MRMIAPILFLSLAACASDGIRPLRPYEIATAPFQSGSTESYVGSLMYEGGCLLFRSEDDTVQLFPVWPTGSRFQESLLTFHRPAKADESVIIAQEIKLDGHAAEWSSLGATEYGPFRQQCAAVSRPFFVSGVTPAN